MSILKMKRRATDVFSAFFALSVAITSHAAEELIPKFAVIPSLKSEVTIDLDRVEVPTIQAMSIEDAARAEGWIHARERFLQMDLARREAAGELWELIPQAKARDLETLPLQLRDAAQRALGALPPAQRALLDSYAEGVNAFLATTTPFEYNMLKLKPAPWKAEDSLLIQLGMARYLDSSPQADRARTPLFLAFPKVAEFFTSSRGTLDRSIDGSPLPQPIAIPDAAALDLRRARSNAALPARTQSPSSAESISTRDVHPGSNAFAVAGSRTKDGRAIVANDMHLMLTAPGIWYRVRLLWPEHTLEGLSLPGVPLIVQGTNGHVAWAFTNLTADLADLIVVEADPTDPTRYQTNSGSQPFATRVVRVGTGTSAEEVTLRTTEFGPIVETREDGTMLALRWAPLREGGLDCGLFELANAKTLDDALATARGWHGPPQNFLVADNSGRIGWTIAGALPDRSDRTSRIVSWRDAPEWRGTLDPGAKPTIVDPAEGILTSANQLSLAPAGPIASLIGADEAHGDRAFRIAELLRARQDWTEVDLHGVQLDVRSPRLVRWRDAIVAALGEKLAQEEIAHAKNANESNASDERSAPAADLTSSALAVELLRAWNGDVSVNASAPVLLDAVRSGLRRAMAEALAADARVRGVEIDAQQIVMALDDEALLRILETRPPHLLPRGQYWSALTQELLDAAATASFVPASGEKPAGFRTRGEVNRAAIRHPAADALGAAARLAEMPRAPLPGHPTTVRVQTPSFGASQRSVVSPSREDEAILVTPAGQSGLPTSPHFRSLHKSWQDGTPYPFRPSEPTARIRMAAEKKDAASKANDASSVTPSNR